MFMNKKFRVAFFLQSLDLGGTENVVLKVLEKLDRTKFIIDLVLLSETGQLLDNVPPDVHIVDLHKKSKFDFFKVIKRFKDYLRDDRPDAVLSFLTYTNLINSIAAKAISGRGPRFILCERSAIQAGLRNSRSYPIKLLLIKHYFKFADVVTANSEGIKNELSELLGDIKVKVIPNPLDIKDIQSLAADKNMHVVSKPYLLTVGRLVEAKSQDILIKAFSYVKKDRPDIKLVLVGDGDKKHQLESLAKELGLDPDIILTGTLINPFPLLKSASCFVLSSNREGFPNAIIEAMACGIPVISTDCEFGPGEIIKNGENGFLTPVNDPEKLGQAILTVLNDEKLAAKFSANGLEAIKKFEINKVVKEFEDLITG